jgi:hypothetical protein
VWEAGNGEEPEVDFKVYMLATVDMTGRIKGNSTSDKDAGN